MDQLIGPIVIHPNILRGGSDKDMMDFSDLCFLLKNGVPTKQKSRNSPLCVLEALVHEAKTLKAVKMLRLVNSDCFKL